MTNETRKRIRAYQKALPELRERVIVVSLLLAMSVSMLGSASFAWLTISRRPEVSEAKTTVAANGNLEIALATSNKAPEESKVGDSSAAENQTVAKSNATWGNLVNLSDEFYGLSNLVLRPALLNDSDLLNTPLSGASYSYDGRIEELTSDYRYTQWVPSDGTAEGYFGLATTTGVRGISSTKVETTNEFANVYALQNSANSMNLQAKNAYLELTRTESYMKSLAYIMGVFMTDRMNQGENAEESFNNPSLDKEHMNNLINMYAAFLKAYEYEANAMAQTLNLQLYLRHSGKTDAYKPYTVNMLMQETANSLKNQNLSLREFDTFKSHYTLIKTDLENLRIINQSGTVRWQTTTVDGTEDGRNLKKIIGSLVNLNSCTIDGTLIQNIGASAALTLNNKSCNAIITNGVLKEFERRVGARMNVGSEYNSGKGLKVTASGKRYGMKQNGTIYAKIVTDADGTALFTLDLSDSMNLSDVEFEGNVFAQDTYGLAIDMWVRTNAVASYLTLEGTVRYAEGRSIDVMGADSDGKEVQLYTVNRSYTDEESGEESVQTIDLYQKEATILDENNQEVTQTVWYRADNHVIFTLEENETPVKKVEVIYDPIGYDGENRVWITTTGMSPDATTQGSGSCYVYYADTPEDQARSIELLKAFVVAFVNENGDKVARAIMDTENAIVESGRVTVPLVLDSSDSLSLGADLDGKDIRAIMALDQNKPTWLTAIVYLDGGKLTNQQVLAASEIQGQLNIQFGSTAVLEALDNETLWSEERVVSATVTPTEHDFTSGEPMTSTITVKVDGSQPKSVTAFFLREISASQGSREPVIPASEWTQNADGEWVATYTFTAPGKYVLRSVQLDGVDYLLETTPRVEIEGFAVKRLECEEADAGRNIHVLTAANSYPVHFELEFGSTDQAMMPKKVQARFLRDGDGVSVNVEFTVDANGIWHGGATFFSSGEYTLQYLILDGEYVELPSNLQQKANIKLGIQAAVYTDSPTTMKYEPYKWEEDLVANDNKINLYMKVKLVDNGGNPLPGMTNVSLRYSRNGSKADVAETALTWNAISGYYEGTFPNDRAAKLEFQQVRVVINGVTNEIDKASVAPAFEVISPNPPAYHAYLPDDYQFNSNLNASFMVELEYADTAYVYGLVRNVESGKTEIVPAVNMNMPYKEGDVPISIWSVPIPKDGNSQEGIWELLELRLWNYYDKEGNLQAYEEGAEFGDEDGKQTSGMCLDLRKVETRTKVVETVVVESAEDKSQNFGVDASGTVTGQFLASYDVSGLEIIIRDKWNAEIPNVTNVKMIYNYDYATSAYGHYTSDDLQYVADQDDVIYDSHTPGTTVYTQSAEKKVTLTYAGKYTPNSINYAISDTNALGHSHAFTTSKLATTLKNVATFTVSSKAPAVAITAISPTGTYNVDKTDVCGSDDTDCDGNVTTNKNTHEDNGAAASYTATEANVYFKCTRGNTLKGNHNYTRPSVTITLSNMGAATQAELSFGSSSHVYNGTTQTGSFAWTANGACKRNIGYYSSSTVSSDTKTSAGTIAADTLVLTYNGTTFKVSANIKINNPY